MSFTYIRWWKWKSYRVWNGHCTREKIYMYHEGNSLQTTFYHLPEVHIFEGDAKEFVAHVMNNVDV